jgi:hypothetical protein
MIHANKQCVKTNEQVAACMAHNLREHNVAAVSLYPGLVRTESVLRAAEHFDLSCTAQIAHRASHLPPPPSATGTHL